MSEIDRRAFLGKSTKTIVTLGTAGLALRRSSTAASPSERVRLAAIGVGGRCSSLIRGFLARKDCEVVTLCDVYPGRDTVVAARKEVEAKQGKAPPVVQDYRRVLDDPSIDAVIIGTPDHWHSPLSIFACQAGKDVYVEKPPSRNVWEGRKLAEAEKRYKRVVQVGTQNRSAPYNIKALELIRSGALGKIHLCKVYNLKPGGRYKKAPAGTPPAGMDYDTWLGPAPERPYSQQLTYGGGWHHYWDFSGGDMADDGVHQLDIARWLTGMEYPTSVRATGGNFAFQDDSEVPDTQIASYDFDDMIMTFELTGWAPYMHKTNNQIRTGKGFPLWLQNATRIEFYGSKNLMILGRHGGGWQVFTGDGEVVSQEWGLFPDDAHRENFLSSIKSRKKANANAEEGHRSALLVHLANIAYRVGSDLRFDRETETFVDNAPANALAKGHYRKNFSVPDTV